MIAKLIRHTFKDEPNWQLVNDNVPLGTEYEIIGFMSNIEIINLITKERRIIDCYYVIGNNGRGYMPIDVFDVD